MKTEREERGWEDELSVMGRRRGKVGGGSGGAAKTWPKMKTKRGHGVIDRLIPPHAPVTRLIGVAKTEAGRGKGERRQSHGSVRPLRSGLCRVCAAAPPSSLQSFPSKLHPQGGAGNESCKGFLLSFFFN